MAGEYGMVEWTDGIAVHEDLAMARAAVFDAHGLLAGTPVPEPESAPYGAYALTVDGRSVRFRVAKTTPTKSGQFVTLWRRSAAGPIRPFDVADGVDLFVVSVREAENCGQFVFPVAALVRHGVVSRGGAGGKRAIRVYAPWLSVSSGQAARTQAWQRDFFLPLDAAQPGIGDRIRALYAA